MGIGIHLGIDIGGSTTKVAGFSQKGAMVGTLKVSAEDPLTCTYGAFGRFMGEHSLSLKDISEITLTGVGATFVDGPLYGIPTRKIPELEAIGHGGLILSGLKEALVVSMGTGTAFVRACEDQIEHVGGSGVGGGTLCGLSSGLLHEQNFGLLSRLAEHGDAANVDLLIRDIYRGSAPTLMPELTASNFGKLKSGAASEDLASALFNLVFQTIGLLALFACRNDRIKDIVLTGSLTDFPKAKEIFDSMGRLYGVRYLIPEHAAYATAIGCVTLTPGINLSPLKQQFPSE